MIAVPKETAPGERRVALVPEVVRALVKDGFQVAVETGAGAAAGFPDALFRDAGASLAPDAAALLASADLVVKVRPPRALDGRHEVDLLRPGSILLGFLRPLDEPELAAKLAARGVSAFAMELMPRITRAQAMDALSSQATIAGYRAVLLGASVLPKIFPMLVTAAGTLSAARVFVVGAGVAGLQALATAKRLGAVTEAYDVRPAAKEQVLSVGARFVELALETADSEDKGGYAKAQSEEFYRKQRELLGERVRAADVVITTALVPGRRAPVLVEPEAVRGMRPGSVLVDLAAEQGGNCPLTQADRVVIENGVTILGPTNLPSEAPLHASQMYARNVSAFLRHLAPKAQLALDLSDELTRAPLLTHEGKLVNEAVQARLGGAA
ncbi:MAG TPA: Re/Si-specific NAD(P)(+) transhydrogenase subunit alpha [Myxococcota bacterium]|nr:Re/Si-specific NAD(P)(+) transhydrogenase subunit alpha [Myxococcota bacterium]